MIKKCKFCQKEFETKTKAEYCCEQCKQLYITHTRFPDGSDYVECKICGMRAKQLLQHIEKVHNITVEEYCIKYNCVRSDLTTKTLHEQLSTNIKKAVDTGKCGWQKGSKNPSHSDDCKNGRTSAWSKNFKGYDGLSDEEKELKIKELSNKVVDSMNTNHNNPLRLDYYTSRGYSELEAKELLKNRQCTFSLETCIEKYGEEEGIKVFNERQEKWQNTLNSKPFEEIERINKAKMLNGKGYSNISQELFKIIDKKLNTEFSNMYYATNNGQNNFNEYMVTCISGHKYFLDFYIKDNNKVIEFDGDYWHGKKRGNQERDKKREEELKSLGFINIMHVKERDYRSNPEKVIQECIEFIRK